MTSIREESLDLGWDGHLLLLHRSEDERRDALAAWVLRGLDLGERVVFAERDDDLPDRSLPNVLRQRGVDVATASEQGRLHALPAREYYPEGGQIELLNQAREAGFSAIRITAETRTALTVLTVRAYAEAESTLEFLCSTQPMSALCQYAPGETPGLVVQNGYERHPTVREAQLQTRRDDGALLLAGEIDQQNSDVLEATLRAASANAEEDLLWIDLSRVVFLEVHACRALVMGTQRFRDDGGDVILHSPTGGVQRALRLLGVHLQPRITMVRERP